MVGPALAARASRRTALHPAPRQADGRRHLVAHSSRFCAHSKALPGASAACRKQPKLREKQQHVPTEAALHTVTQTQAGSAHACGMPASSSSSCGAARRYSTLLHLRKRARGEQHAVEQQQRHGAPDKHFAQVAGELPVDVLLGRSQLWGNAACQKNAATRVSGRCVQRMQGQALGRAVDTACEAANTWRPTKTRARARACRFMYASVDTR